MSAYRHVLVAVDLHPDCDSIVVQRAKEIADQFQAKLSIVHAIEHINAYGLAQAYPGIIDLEDELVNNTKLVLAELAQKFNIPLEQQLIQVGPPKFVILEQAKKFNVDLIIVGSHGRHGISLLLGSTSNAVLHHAECDVLAVRVKSS